MKKLLSLFRRAAEDYHMIDDGDKIAVGLSGGKDSLTLLYLLSAMQRFFPKRYDLVAITIDLGFPGADFSPLQEACDRLGVPFVLKHSDIGEILFDIRKESNPCSLCAKMRRGALNELALANGCNKLALGHHNDDVVETFFLSLFYEGRISCFSPVTYLSRTGITQIRPMIYIPEKEIKAFARKNELPVVHNPCPANGNTKRQYVKDFIRQLNRENHGVKERIFGALQRANIAGFSDQNPCVLPPTNE